MSPSVGRLQGAWGRQQEAWIPGEGFPAAVAGLFEPKIDGLAICKENYCDGKIINVEWWNKNASDAYTLSVRACSPP